MAQKQADPLIHTIECALDLGQYISYNDSWDFIHSLEDAKNNIDIIVKETPQRAFQLYEIFMHGCCEKIEELDDSSGNMGMFFEDLFCSWVKARQKSKCSPVETLELIRKWKEHDDYGLCHEIEKRLIPVFDKKTIDLFEKTIHSEIEEGQASLDKDSSGSSYRNRYNSEIIKLIYTEKNNFKSYIEYVQKMGMTPKDCEEIAKIFQKKKKYAEAMEWVEKGLKLNSKNSSSYELGVLMKELLSKLGNKDGALNLAWDDFKKHPSDFSYKDLMKYVPFKGKNDWHNKVIDHIKDGPIEPVLAICVDTKEYGVLVDRILRCRHQTLEEIGHHSTEKAAKLLEKKHPEAAAKIYRALGVRIVNSKKSKYYSVAWEHFEKTKELYLKIGQEKEWDILVSKTLCEHSRKSSFIDGFKEIVAGTKKKKVSFAERAENRWK